MAYFRNRAVNLLNLHYAINAAVLTGGGAFYFVYFLKAGFSPATVLLFFASILIGRFIIRPAIVPAAVRCGLRRLLILGNFLVAAQYPLLAQVTGVGPLLYLLCAVAAIGDTVYWTTYHAYFAALGDQEHRGHQIGAREAIGAIVGIVSPLATGLALASLGPRWAFAISAALQILAAAPLLGTPEVAVAREVRGSLKAALPGVLLFMADGWIQGGNLVIWQMGLFLTLGESYVAFGGALAAAALVGAFGGLVLGRFIDAGHGRSAVWLALGLLMALIALRAAVLGHATLAITANALGALVSCAYTPTLMTAVYTLSKRSPCPLRFHVAAEAGWDMGGAAISLVGAFLFSRHVPIAAGVLLALIGAGGSLVLLLRYYGRQAK